MADTDDTDYVRRLRGQLDISEWTGLEWMEKCKAAEATVAKQVAEIKQLQERARAYHDAYTDEIRGMQAEIEQLQNQHRRDIELRKAVDRLLFKYRSRYLLPLEDLARAYECLHDDAAIAAEEAGEN
jgi:hypothetical protein